MDAPKPLSSLTSRRIIKSLKAKADAKRKVTERAADWMTSVFGTVTFLLINGVLFLAWIFYNMYPATGGIAFDPFPFGLLTMIVSLEAIFLSIVVLISQNRAGKIADLREEIDLQLDIITEQELTKLMHMVALLMEKQGLPVRDDKILESMLHPIDLEKIEKALQQQVDGNNN